MRAVIQRVSEASVTIGGTVKAAMGPGVLLGVEPADTPEDIAWLSGKITRLRIFSDDQGLMNRSVQETGRRRPGREPVHPVRQDMRKATVRTPMQPGPR